MGPRGRPYLIGILEYMRRSQQEQTSVPDYLIHDHLVLRDANTWYRQRTNQETSTIPGISSISHSERTPQLVIALTLTITTSGLRLPYHKVLIPLTEEKDIEYGATASLEICGRGGRRCFCGGRYGRHCSANRGERHRRLRGLGVGSGTCA